MLILGRVAGQISASLASFSRTIDDYAALAKSELIPEKKEKAIEREKSFRASLLDYRQQFERLRKEREETVSSSAIFQYNCHRVFVNCLGYKGIRHKSQRTIRSSSTSRCYPREPLRRSRLTSIFGIRQYFFLK